MKHITLAIMPLFALTAAAAQAEPRALGNLDYCATYAYASDGTKQTWSICRSGSRVWAEHDFDLHRREIWDYARAYRATIWVKERKYTESTQHRLDERTRDALRPYPVKMLAMLTEFYALRARSIPD